MSLTNANPSEAAQAARLASRTLAILPTTSRNEALSAVHDALLANKTQILQANKKDMEAALKAVDNGALSQSLVKRLDLGKPGKFEDMLQGILDVRKLEDPVGKINYKCLLDDGLVLERKSSPIGVLLIIFEARPEVIVNAASLAIKSGNSAILKGGKESIESFKAISTIISQALSATEVPNDALQLVTTRDAIAPLLKLDQYIDLVIPRGGNELVRSIMDSTKIPVLGHADGLCSIYLRGDYPSQDATKIILDAKLGYTAACNSVETLLVDEAALKTNFVSVVKALITKGVEIRADEESFKVLGETLEPDSLMKIVKSRKEDYKTEFLDSILAVKTIHNVDQAIEHVNAYSSHHTDAILTLNESIAEKFLASVDSAGVFWNTSTRMADGARLGFGAETGISTGKTHARGPVGLEGLTIYRWILRGSGQSAEDYASGGKVWKHQRLPAGDDEWIAKDSAELDVLREYRNSLKSK